MAKYLITFRLADTNTYSERYTALQNFISNSPQHIIEDTTSTVFIEGPNNSFEMANSIIHDCDLINRDELLIIKIKSVNLNSGRKAGYIDEILKIKNCEVHKENHILSFIEK